VQQSSRLQFTGYLPRYRDVYHRLRDAVLQGVYPYGARVPSIRTLASELGLSRATIEKAYDLLIGEGLSGQPRAGRDNGILCSASQTNRAGSLQPGSVDRKFHAS
jgi:DNA-binding transcriptional MocR family regulator